MLQVLCFMDPDNGDPCLCIFAQYKAMCKKKEKKMYLHGKHFGLCKCV